MCASHREQQRYNSKPPNALPFIESLKPKATPRLSPKVELLRGFGRKETPNRVYIIQWAMRCYTNPQKIKMLITHHEISHFGEAGCDERAADFARRLRVYYG